MKTALSSTLVCLMTGALLVSAGCSKKETPAAQAPAEAAKPAEATPSVADAMKQKAETVAAQAQQEAVKAQQVAAQAQQEAVKAQQAAAAAGESLKTQASTATKEGQTALQSGLAAARTEAQKMEAPKADAAGLLSQYSGQLDMLKTGAVALKTIIDQNAGRLPADVQVKYQQFNAMLPGLGNLVTSLKNYQTADMTTLVPKLQADFGRAQTLYTEIKAMLPKDTAKPVAPAVTP